MREERIHTCRVRFGERDEHVACNASAFALAMIDEACCEAEM